jgi:hypothetical protein
VVLNGSGNEPVSHEATGSAADLRPVVVLQARIWNIFGRGVAIQMEEVTGVVKTELADFDCAGQAPQSRASFQQDKAAPLFLKRTGSRQAGDSTSEYDRIPVLVRRLHDGRSSFPAKRDRRRM